MNATHRPEHMAMMTAARAATAAARYAPALALMREGASMKAAARMIGAPLCSLSNWLRAHPQSDPGRAVPPAHFTQGPRRSARTAAIEAEIIDNPAARNADLARRYQITPERVRQIRSRLTGREAASS